MVPELEVVSRVRLVPKMEVVPEVGKFSRTQTSQEKNTSNSTHKLTMPQAAGNKTFSICNQFLIRINAPNTLK